METYADTDTHTHTHTHTHTKRYTYLYMFAAVSAAEVTIMTVGAPVTLPARPDPAPFLENALAQSGITPCVRVCGWVSILGGGEDACEGGDNEGGKDA